MPWAWGFHSRACNRAQGAVHDAWAGPHNLLPIPVYRTSYSGLVCIQDCRATLLGPSPGIDLAPASRPLHPGVAPFRAFLQEREAQLLALQAELREGCGHDASPTADGALQQGSGSSMGPAGQGTGHSAGAPVPAPCLLFFGCRRSDCDFYYEQEWRAMQGVGVLAPPPLGLVTAFSREQEAKVWGRPRYD